MNFKLDVFTLGTIENLVKFSFSFFQSQSAKFSAFLNLNRLEFFSVA